MDFLRNRAIIMTDSFQKQFFKNWLKMNPAADNNHTTKSDQRVKNLKGWGTFFGIVYRIILIIGLLLLAATAVLIYFTRRTYLWVSVVPLGMITLGILLARVEYCLHLRLHQSQNLEHKT